MFKYLCCALFMLAGQAFAGEWRLLDLEKFSMDHAKIVDYRDPYYPYTDPNDTRGQEHWDSSTAANFDLTLVGYKAYRLYWNNRVQGDQTNSQFRQVGWHFQWGVNFGDYVNTFYRHVSRHILDERSDTRYPIENLYGVELIFFQKGRDTHGSP